MSKRIRLTIIVDDERVIDDNEDIDEVKEEMLEDMSEYLRDCVVPKPHHFAEWDITEEQNDRGDV